VYGSIPEHSRKTFLIISNSKKKEITDKQGTVIQISKELTDEQLERANILIKKYQHLFTSDQLDINCAKVEAYEVKLNSGDPVFQAPYRVSPKQREKLRVLIDKMIKAYIIETSKSSYVAPVFIKPKKQKGNTVS